MRLHLETLGAASPRPAAFRWTLAAAVFVLGACSGGDSTDPGGGGATASTVEVSAGSASLEVGETIKLTAIAKDKDGNLLSGKTFAWTSSNVAVAAVLPDGSVTGQTVGSATIFASVDGKSGSVQLNVTPATIPTISSISPSPLVPGQTATINGTNFSANPASNAVTIGGATAAVTAAGATSLTVTVPSALCVPGTAPVQVTVNGRGSNVIQQPAPASGSPVTTGVGQLSLLTDPGSFCVQFPANSSAEAYLIGVQSVTESGTTVTPVAVGLTAIGSSPEFASSFPVAPVGFENYTPAVIAGARTQRWRRQRIAEFELRQKEREQLDYQTMASFVRDRSSTQTRGDVLAAAAAAVPATFNVGDQVPIRVPDRSGNLCSDFTAITTVVRAIGTHSVWLEDTANPTNGYSTSDFQQLAAAFETIYNADIGYFGTPPDMGNNGRIVIVVTKEVNKAGVLGFATTADLRPRTGTTNSCPSSDETYIFYDIAPDPQGSFGDAYTRDTAFQDGPVLIGHEFVHIIQFGIRPTVPNSQGLGLVWELEGQATYGEEIVGNAYTGRSPGQNYGFNIAFNCADPPGCTQNVDANDWYIASFIDLILYYGFNANCATGDNTCLNVQLTGAPEQCTWLALDNGGPCYPGRDVYGVPWSLYRWLSDNYSSNLAGGEKELMKKMVANGFTGFQTVTDVIGRPIDELLSLWAAALYVDNRLTGTVDPRLTFSSWNLSDINSHLRASAQLQPRDRSFTTFTDNVQVRGGSTAYFRLSGARQSSALRVTGTGGAILSGSMRVFIVRLQ
jgi:IPT/TIG domain/Bacterial Ig-like domain (group 2)